MFSKFLFIFVIYRNIAYAFKCGTGQLKNEPYMISNDKVNNNKRRLSTEFTPIKIKVDYKLLSNQVNIEQLNYFKEVFSNVVYYFNSLLLVQHDNIDIDEESIKKHCFIDDIENGAGKIFYDYDLIIIPYIEDSLDKNVLAAASPCLYLSNFKPIGGVVEINQDLVMSRYDSKDFLEKLLLHELSHVLCFHPIYFSKLNLTEYEIKNNRNHSYITSPKVLEKARIHFNCKDIKGIQLEDQGGEGSIGAHWEARYMLGDYMISTDYPEVVISDITLALFEDTGFYKVNYYTGGLFRFGKNQGCSFLEEKCVKNKKEGLETDFPNDFCLEDSKAFCGSSHIARGICVIREVEEELEEDYQYFDDSNLGGGFSIANYCPVSSDFRTGNSFEKYYNNPNNCKNGLTIFSQYGEKIGDNSFCFESSLLPRYSLSNVVSTQNRSICYNIECDKFRKEIIIYIDSLKVYCPGNRTVLTNPEGFIGNILCPEYNLVCSSEVQCNDMLDCIIKNSTASRNTYLYLKSKIFEINFIFYLIIVLYFI